MPKPSFSSAQLGMIGAQSARWPAPDTNPFWAAAHSLITDVVQTVREVDEAVAGIYTDSDLSDVGRLRRAGELALAAINKISDSGWTPYQRLLREQLRREEVLKKQRGDLPRTPKDAADAAIAQEIRAWLRGQEDPVGVAYKLRTDERLVAAIASAPPFLVGMTAEQHGEFIKVAESGLWPDVAEQIEAISKAVDVAEKAIRKGGKMIAERGQLLRTADGYELKPRRQAA